MSTGSPRRFLQALAVTLPLGLDPAGDGGVAPRVAVPPEIVADTGSLGAVGLVFRPGIRSEVCAAVALRDRALAPLLASLHWRASAGPGQAEILPVERLPSVETPEGFTVWFGCAPAASPGPGAAVSAILVPPKTAPTPAWRRIDLPGDSSGVWHWRLVAPVEARAELAVAPQRPRTEERPRGVAVFAATPPD